MRWSKRGLIYAPSGSQPWARTHALLPTPLFNGGDAVRVYFSSLDESQFGSLGWADVEFSPEKATVVNAAAKPLLEAGEKGTFDDCGVAPSCALRVREDLYLYYAGFQRAERVPYMIFSGVAAGDGNGSVFRRCSRTPVLDRTASEPFSRGAPFVLNESGDFRMWYWSCTHWSEGANGTHYNTVIRHATSPDGLNWRADRHICIAPDLENEYAVGRPWVIREAGLFRMWYSIRSRDEGYTIGYAESGDGIRWERRDRDAGIEKSAGGWDSEMICYPAVFDRNGVRYMLYNGNRCGRTGFGYAVLER
jgi:hypothetical protein